MSRTIPRGTGRSIRHALSAIALLCIVSGDDTRAGQAPERTRLGIPPPSSPGIRRERLRSLEGHRRRQQLYPCAIAALGLVGAERQWKLYTMLTNEHRHWFKSNKGLENKDFEIHELIFENLYLEGKKLGGSPFGFVVGRQNLFYGEGFICWDGGPLDGSRTAYFNALLVSRRRSRSAGSKRTFLSDPEAGRICSPSSTIRSNP